MPLRGVSETLFIPLYARARESRRPDAIVSDPLAVRLAEALQYDWSRFGLFWAAQTGVAIRTSIIDRETRRFLDEHPDGVVVNLGAGLCTRFYKLDTGRCRWFEIDLPAVSDIWHTLLHETDRHRFVARSIVDFAWVDAVKQTSGDAYLFIAEGVLIYFSESDVRRVLTTIAENFPGAELLIEAISPALAASSRIHPLLSKTEARFAWGVKSLGELERLVPGLRLVDEWFLFDFHRERWRYLRWLFWSRWFRTQLKVGLLRVAS
jgi:O-methyltransferase involved in polyketide biosynthesis